MVFIEITGQLLSGGAFELTRPSDWPKQIGQSGGIGSFNRPSKNFPGHLTFEQKNFVVKI